MINSIKQFLNTYIHQPDENSNAPSEHALQIATAALLIEIMRADGSTQKDEKQKIVGTIRSRFALTEEESEALIHIAENEVWKSTGFYEFTSLINKGLSYKDKVKVIENLWEVALVDTRLDKYEEHTVRKIADLLYVAHKDFIEAKLRVKKHLSNSHTS
jgi:uncharacterized tellurite resistance protein B-like protein